MSDQAYVERPEPLRGYRELTAEEKALVDAIKRAEVEVGQLWATVKATADVDPRMVAHSRTVLQDGFMWLVRSVTRPRDVFASASEAQAG